MDIEKLESYITPKTVAIMPVDYAGNPAEMDEINAIARKHNLYIVQDSAQAIGSKYKGFYTGNQAHVTTFSFHGTKNMTTGEGGAIVTNDDHLADLIKVMREKGTDKYSFLTDNVTRGYYEDPATNGATITAGGTVNVDAVMEHSVDTTNVQCGDFHIHTLRSNDASDDGALKLRAAVAEGLEITVRTDHEYVEDFQALSGIDRFMAADAEAQRNPTEAAHRLGAGRCRTVTSPLQ